MNIGDKVIVKEPITLNNVNLAKSAVGEIIDVDMFGEFIYVKFPNGAVRIEIKNFIDKFELFKTERAPVPVILRSWFIDTEPYMRRFRDD